MDLNKRKDMKKFKDLTISEIIELNDEKIRYYINLAKVDAGVPLVKMEIEEPETQPLPSPTVELYYVHALGSSICVRNKKTLDMIIELVETGLLFRTDYHYIGGEVGRLYYPSGSSNPSETGFSKIRAYKSSKEADEARAIHEANRNLLSEVQDVKKENDIAKEIEVTILQTIGKVHDRVGEARWYNDTFVSEYLPLLNGDFETALTLFKKAYPIEADIEEFIRTDDLNVLKLKNDENDD